MKVPRPSESVTASPSPSDSEGTTLGAEPAADHLAAHLRRAAALAHRAIAAAWSSGLLTTGEQDARAFEHEVHALAGRPLLFDATALAEIDGRIEAANEQISTMEERCAAAGQRLPLLALADELYLSPDAIQVLVLAAAPALTGELARLYEILAFPTSRALPDRHLLHALLAAASNRPQRDVDAELRPRAPLVRHGALTLAGARDHLIVHPLVLDRLRGFDATENLEPIWQWRPPTPDAAFTMTGDYFEKVTRFLSRSHPKDVPLRLVARGPAGSGRRTVLAWLASRASRRLFVAAAHQQGRFADSMRINQAQLRSVHLSGGIPCIVGLDEVSKRPHGDLKLEPLIEAIHQHPAPVAICASPDLALPSLPGWSNMEIPPGLVSKS